MPGIALTEVVAAIADSGRWSRNHEWRISTVTSTEIVRTGDQKRHRAYRVRVECDFVFEAHCPTITRAIETVSMYEKLVQTLWADFGWPSWAAQRLLEPAADAV